MASKPKDDPRALSDLNEVQLARTIVERGMATQDDVDRCKAIQERLSRRDEYKTLLDLLVENQAITANQAKRLLEDAGTGNRMREPPGYRILAPIAQGSMGVVYKAKQLSMDRSVALKVLLRQLAANKAFIERFHHEARIAAKLSHNNIVQAIDSGEFAGHHYFVMEYMDGTNIKQELDRGKVYEEAEALRIILQIAEALDHAHQKGLIHRDIKPDNIMLMSDGTAKLADLGLARLTADEALAQAERGIAVGTPYYISPEQIRGDVHIDTRADIYSLGATLYHMVTGRVPFSGKMPTEVMQKHLHTKLVPPDHLNTRLTGGLGEVVETMMAKDRDARYSTPQDLIIDLKNLMQGSPPVIARERIGASTMQSLADGDEADGLPPNLRTVEKLTDELDRSRSRITVLSTLLLFAVIVILILLVL